MNPKLALGAALLAACSFTAVAQMTPTTPSQRSSTPPDRTMPADHAMPASDASTASDPFVKMDKDGDGAISKAEATGKVRANWSKYDANKDGKVDSAEFAQAAN